MPAALTLTFAGLFGMSAVALGAFAAHGLKGRLAESALSAFETGVHYQMVHALALLALVPVQRWLVDSGLIGAAVWVLVAGMVLFSGSLYGLALGGPRWLGPVTPLGGLLLMLGWLLILVAGLRALRL